MNKDARAEILVNGLVQGIGFRYFVYRHAVALDLKGYCKNLYSGEVYTVVEGEKHQIDELIKLLRVGPMHASVKNCRIDWSDYKNEFTSFEIKH